MGGWTTDRRALGERPGMDAGTRGTVRSGYLLIGNTAVTALMGIAYWAVAARLLSQTALGAGAAAIALVAFLSAVGQVNLAFSLPVLLPRAGPRMRGLLLRTYGLAVLVSVVVGLGFVILSESIGSDGEWRVVHPLVLVLCTVAWSLFTIQDGALVGVRKAWLVPTSNAAFGIMKLVLLVVLLLGASSGVGHGAGALVVSWFLPTAVLIAGISIVLWRVAGKDPPTSVERMPHLRSFLAWDYVGGLANHAGTTALPFLVAWNLGAGESAVFIAAWTLVAIADLVANNLAEPMAVQVAGGPGAGRSPAEGAVARRLLVVIPAGVVFGVVTATAMLHIYGAAYADQSAGLLRIMLVATLLRAVMTYTVWALRARAMIRAAAGLQIACAAVTVAVALALSPALGVVAFGWGMVAGCAVAAVASAVVLRRVWKAPR